MSGFQHDIAGGNGNLIITSVQSPNFVHGSAGWQISKNGNAEFNNAIIRNGTVISGTSLYYSSDTPALGNLIASVSAVAGTDASGNAYLPGQVSYLASGGGYLASQLYNGALFLQQNTVYGGAYTVYGEINVGGTSMQFSNGSSTAFRFVGAPITSTGGTPSNPTLITTDTWNNLTLTNGWGMQASLYARYRRMPDNSVKLDAKLTTGTLTNGTVIATLPTGYLPAFTQPVGVKLENPATVTAPALTPRADVQTNGQIQIFNLPAGLTQASINDTFPLD